jgi:site-specific DNA-cytosine methylase
MKVLELFAGSRSIGKVAEELGLEVFSSDNTAFDNINYVVDILEFDYDKVPFTPDIIWASPPCTGFSVAALGHHWKGSSKGVYEPFTDTAKLGIKLVEKTIEIINHYQPKYWFIENPRGILRKMPMMQDFTRNTVTYCQYGEERMKPTDIWTNSDVWIPKPACKNGDPCHVAAPRGSSTGTQGLKGAYERSKLPAELCREVLTSCL